MYYLITGPTSTGKDKIANYIIDNFKSIKNIKSTTSRPIRPNEKNGVEYHFKSSEEFKKIINEDGFVEYRTYNTMVKDIPDIWYYGVEKKHAKNDGTDYIVVIDFQGAMEFADYFGRENCVLVYVKSLYQERYIRNILRGDFDQTEWLRRNSMDSGWLSEAEKVADVIIENYGYEYPENPNDEGLRIDITEEGKYRHKNDFEDTKVSVNNMIKRFSGYN